MRRYGPDQIAKGHAGKGDSRKVVILLDEETFSDVRMGALSSECSFAAQARMLIEVGLETLKLDAAEVGSLYSLKDVG